MSFSSLPTELVRQIIESSIPPVYSFEVYLKRQKTLRTLCRVSRLFRQLAQPLLAEILSTFTLTRLIKVLPSLPTSGGAYAFQQARIRDAAAEQLRGNPAKTLIENCPNLRILTLDLDADHPLNLSTLEVLPNLVKLELFDAGYRSFGQFTLAALESLTLVGGAIETAASILSPTVLPSLKTLAFYQGDEGQSQASYFPSSQLNHLITQLEAIFLHNDLVAIAPLRLLAATDLTLFDLFVDETYDSQIAGSDARHLRIRSLDASSHYSDFDVVSLLTLEIEDQVKVSLRSIYLDISLESDFSPYQDTEDFIGVLIEVCHQKGIEVIFEEQNGENVDPFCSEEFHRRQMEEKRRMKKE